MIFLCSIFADYCTPKKLLKSIQFLQSCSKIKTGERCTQMCVCGRCVVAHMWTSYLYQFTCFSSCAGGLNRRPFQVVFSLETGCGRMLGRNAVEVSALLFLLSFVMPSEQHETFLYADRYPVERLWKFLAWARLNPVWGMQKTHSTQRGTIKTYKFKPINT